MIGLIRPIYWLSFSPIHRFGECPLGLGNDNRNSWEIGRPLRRWALIIGVPSEGKAKWDRSQSQAGLGELHSQMALVTWRLYFR